MHQQPAIRYTFHLLFKGNISFIHYMPLLLIFGLSFLLSAEAVEKFGPMHVPIATKRYENLFVALANRKRVDGSTLCSSAGCIRCAPKIEYLIYILA